MNTIDDLIEHGIGKETATDMLAGYFSKIGTMNGIYEIIDITYDFSSKSRDVVLKCTECGRVIRRSMKKGRNKWSELIKTCPCQKEREEEERRRLLEKFQNEKKSLLEGRVGKEYGDYEVASLDDNEESPRYTLRCMECGREKVVSALSFGQIKDFKCHKHYCPPIKFDDSYIGKKNNFLEVIGIAHNEAGKRKFVCKCDCGNTTMVEPIHWENGTVKSCGCMQRELNRQAVTTHGHSKERLYRVWNGMKERCRNPNNNHYQNYGGRGICVCDEWSNDYSAFRDWAYDNGYDENASRGECTIDRINVNGNYEPDNCRWISNEEQQKNKRPSDEWKKREPKKYIIGDTEKTLDEWCMDYGLTAPAVAYRIKRKGMRFEEALKSPKQAGRPVRRAEVV